MISSFSECEVTISEKNNNITNNDDDDDNDNNLTTSRTPFTFTDQQHFKT